MVFAKIEQAAAEYQPAMVKFLWEIIAMEEDPALMLRKPEFKASTRQMTSRKMEDMI